MTNTGRSKRIRTSGPCVPNAVLYQAELYSDEGTQDLMPRKTKLAVRQQDRPILAKNVCIEYPEH